MKKIFKNIFGEDEEMVEEEYYDDEEVTSEISEEALESTQKIRAVILEIEPASYREATKIGDEIGRGKIIIIKTTKLDMAETLRLIDIVSGSVHSLNGSVREIATNTYLCSPRNIKVEKFNILSD